MAFKRRVARWGRRILWVGLFAVALLTLMICLPALAGLLALAASLMTFREIGGGSILAMGMVVGGFVVGGYLLVGGIMAGLSAVVGRAEAVLQEGDDPRVWAAGLDDGAASDGRLSVVALETDGQLSDPEPEPRPRDDAPPMGWRT